MAGLALGGIFALVPFLWMISTSFKTPDQLFVFPPEFIPDPVAPENYLDAWNALPFGSMLLNSLFVTGLAMFGELLSASLVAYGFARFRFRFRNALFVLMLSTMMLPWVVTLIPSFLIWKQLGLINTFDPLTIQALFAWGPLYIFLLRQFFMGVSREIEEAAIVDGANPVQVLWHVMLPLVKPVLLAIGLLSFVGNWNNFRLPLIYLSPTDRAVHAATRAPVLSGHTLGVRGSALALHDGDVDDHGRTDPGAVLPRPAAVHRRHPARRGEGLRARLWAGEARCVRAWGSAGSLRDAWDALVAVAPLNIAWLGLGPHGRAAAACHGRAVRGDARAGGRKHTRTPRLRR